MSQTRNLSRLGLALALILTVAGGASADIAIYDLTVSNLGSGFTGPFVEVKVDLTDSTHATITFTSLTNGGFEYLMHSNGAAGVNVNGTFTAPAVASVTALAAPGGSNPTVDKVETGSQNLDGMGSYNLVINLKDGSPPPKDAAAEISFGIVSTMAGGWSSATNVLSPNAGGGNGGPSVAAAQIGAWDGVLNHEFTTTGFAGQSVLQPPPPVVTGVPEPSSMAMAALGAVGFLGYGLRRLLKK